MELESFSPSVRERLKSGAIINSKADWEKYNSLSEAQKVIVRNKLSSDPSVTMRKAMEGLAQLPSEHLLNLIGTIKYLEPDIKHRIACGSIAIDTQSVNKLIDMPAEDQAFLSAILDDPMVDSLKSGLMILSGKIKPRTKEQKIAITLSSIIQLGYRIEERLRDLDAIGVGAQEHWESWKAFRASVLTAKEKSNG